MEFFFFKRECCCELGECRRIESLLQNALCIRISGYFINLDSICEVAGSLFVHITFTNDWPIMRKGNSIYRFLCMSVWVFNLTLVVYNPIWIILLCTMSLVIYNANFQTHEPTKKCTSKTFAVSRNFHREIFKKKKKTKGKYFSIYAFCNKIFV